jgi:hypothetical protein
MYHVVVLSALNEVIGRVSAMQIWIALHRCEKATVSSRGSTISAEFEEHAQAEAFAEAFSGRLM